jgi:hypothetical protein
VDNTCCNLGEFDSGGVDTLNEKLPELRCLLRYQSVVPYVRILGWYDLFEILLLGPLQLLLEEQDYLLDVPAGRHAQDNTHSFASHFHIGT